MACVPTVTLASVHVADTRYPTWNFEKTAIIPESPLTLALASILHERLFYDVSDKGVYL